MTVADLARRYVINAWAYRGKEMLLIGPIQFPSGTQEEKDTYWLELADEIMFGRTLQEHEDWRGVRIV